MAREFGAAADYYRLRLVTMSDSDELDLEWRDDILYRTPPSSSPDEYELYRVEAVRLDDEDISLPLATFDSHDEAHEWMDAVVEDLTGLTKAEFDAAYVYPEDAEDDLPLVEIEDEDE